MDIIKLAIESAELLDSYIKRHIKLFRTYAKSTLSFANRMTGKSIKHNI